MRAGLQFGTDRHCLQGKETALCVGAPQEMGGSSPSVPTCGCWKYSIPHGGQSFQQGFGVAHKRMSYGDRSMVDGNQPCHDDRRG